MRLHVITMDYILKKKACSVLPKIARFFKDYSTQVYILYQGGRLDFEIETPKICTIVHLIYIIQIFQSLVLIFFRQMIRRIDEDEDDFEEDFSDLEEPELVHLNARAQGISDTEADFLDSAGGVGIGMKHALKKYD